MELLVQAEFDGELDVEQAAALKVHRDSCPACQAAQEMLVGVRRTLRAADLRERAPARLREMVGQPEAKPVRRLPWRGAASFVLGAAAASVALYMSGVNTPVADEIASAHVRALQPGHMEDVVSTDRHTVKPWFDGKLDFAPPVKDLAGDGFPLLGARTDFIAGRAVAVLVYGHGGHFIDLFVWPGTVATPAALTRRGYRLNPFTAGEMTFWAVSDMDAAEMTHFIDLWRAAP
ncbi:MAG: anti-sigma factor family protein [Candidatus Binataceae bacterium]